MQSVDWKRIRAEYIAGGISQRKLAQKYGVSPTTLSQRAAKEGWKEARDKTDAKARQKTVEKIAERQSNQCADLIAGISDQSFAALKKVAALIEKIPDGSGFFTHTVTEDGRRVSRGGDLRDAVAMLKDLTAIANVAGGEGGDARSADEQIIIRYDYGDDPDA